MKKVMISFFAGFFAGIIILVAIANIYTVSNVSATSQVGKSAFDMGTPLAKENEDGVVIVAHSNPGYGGKQAQAIINRRELLHKNVVEMMEKDGWNSVIEEVNPFDHTNPRVVFATVIKID
ncbi:MAG: hypothetical protein WC819_00075 [Parcubacteria group bacterium]